MIHSGLAAMFFGAGKKEVAKKYVDDVFDKFDYDASGELSYEGFVRNKIR